MSKTVLVTGGAGYIGSHTAMQLSKAGYEVVVLDNLSTGHRNAVKWGTLEVGDLSDKEFVERVFEKYNFHAVLHFAGSIVVPESVENPQKYYLNNTVNSTTLVDQVIKHRIKNFIFSSTAAVYGIPSTTQVSEESPLRPINPYGQSKLMTELMLADAAKAYEGFNYVALRYFNVSGADPEGKIGQAFPGATHLIKVNCEAAAGKRDKVFIFGENFSTRDGTGERDYIHVVDLADAHVEALKYLEVQNKSQVFNCGYGKGFTVKEVVKEVKSVTKVDYHVEMAPPRKGDPDSLISNNQKIMSLLNWNPRFDNLEKIISHAYQWEVGDEFKSWKN